LKIQKKLRLSISKYQFQDRIVLKMSSFRPTNAEFKNREDYQRKQFLIGSLFSPAIYLGK